MVEIEKLELKEWYSCLKPYQSKIIKELVYKYGEEKAAEMWLNKYASKPRRVLGSDESNGKMGFVRSYRLVDKNVYDLKEFNKSDVTDYWSKLKKQLNMFICGHPDYEQEREQLLKIGSPIGLGGVTFLANLISPVIGLATEILIPAIALFLHTTAKIGVKAYCDGISFD